MTDNLRILHVEDDFADAMLLQQALCDAGAFDLELEVARTLSDAKRKLTSRVYDLIVLDLRLPDSITPADTLKRVEKSAKGTPILVLTGSASFDADKLGVDVTVLDKNAFFDGKRTTEVSRLIQSLRDAAGDALRL